MPTNKPFVHLILEPAMLEQIDEIRWGMRLPSRNATIRWLLAAALEQRVIPEPDLSPDGAFVEEENRARARDEALEKRRGRKK